MVDLAPQVIMIPKPVYETMEELDRQYDETFKSEAGQKVQPHFQSSCQHLSAVVDWL